MPPVNTLSRLHCGAAHDCPSGCDDDGRGDGSSDPDTGGSSDGDTGGDTDADIDGDADREAGEDADGSGASDRDARGCGAGRFGTFAPPKRAVNLVNSHGDCATVLQTPDVVPWFGSAHDRSRFTDQKVNRSRW